MIVIIMPPAPIQLEVMSAIVTMVFMDLVLGVMVCLQ